MDFLAITILTWADDKYTASAGPHKWYRQNVSIIRDPRFAACTSAHIGVWVSILACAAESGDGKILMDMKMAVSATRTTRKFLMECCALFQSVGLLEFKVVPVEKAAKRKRGGSQLEQFALENPKNRESLELNNAELNPTFAENLVPIETNSAPKCSKNESHFKDDLEQLRTVDKINCNGGELSTDAPTYIHTDGRISKSVTIVGPVDSVDKSASDIAKLAATLRDPRTTPREYARVIEDTATEVTAKLTTALRGKRSDDAAKALVGDLGWDVVRHRFGSFSAFREAYSRSYREGNGDGFELQLRKYIVVFLGKLSSTQKENPLTEQDQRADAGSEVLMPARFGENGIALYRTRRTHAKGI